MARLRNHQAEYQARNERAQRLGFTGYSQQRRFHASGGREQITTPEFARTSQYASRRVAAQNAVAAYRRNQSQQPPETAPEAVAGYDYEPVQQPSIFDQILSLFGSSQEEARYWAPESFDETTGEPSSFDSGYRYMTVISAGEVIQVDVYSSTEASTIGSYFIAVKEYVNTGNLEPLEQFSGVMIDGYELETDPEKIDYLETTGQLTGLSPYSRLEIY